jgi:hypothetical protein
MCLKRAHESIPDSQVASIVAAQALVMQFMDRIVVTMIVHTFDTPSTG